MSRDYPYGAFNFLVDLNGPDDATKALGGFSDVSGLGTEITIAEYRNGNEAENHPRKVPGMGKMTDITCKRGVMDSTNVWEWIQDVRVNGPAAKRQIKITLLDEARTTVQTWHCFGAVPSKYTGPTFTGKGGGDVAMEEITFSIEGLEIEAG